jgi:glycosyltransferase involved in cell wall biosynthesis
VSERLRVCFFSPAWPPGRTPNGIVTYVANIRRGLDALGLDSSVVAAQIDSEPGKEVLGEVVCSGDFAPPLPLLVACKAYERATGRSALEWRYGCSIAGALRAAHGVLPVDLFEMEESFGAAWFVQGAIPHPLIVRLHGPHVLVAPASGFKLDDEFRRRVTHEGRAIRFADAISSPSKFALERVIQEYGLSSSHGEVIPNPANVEPPDRRWRYDDCNKKQILFVGRFDRLKGADVVLSAFAKVGREIPDAELLYVGPDRGFLDNNGKTWTFEEYGRAHLPHDIFARVRMLGAMQPRAIGSLRRKAFVTVVASRYETFPMTALEALAHGSPLVGAGAGGVPEIVNDGKNALLFQSENADDLARQILVLMRDHELAKRLAGDGAADVERRFAPDVVARQMAAFYERVAARAPSQRHRPRGYDAFELLSARSPVFSRLRGRARAFASLVRA